MVHIEEHELRRVTIFCLKETAERIAALGQTQDPALRARLLAFARQLAEEARSLESGARAIVGSD